MSLGSHEMRAQNVMMHNMRPGTNIFVWAEAARRARNSGSDVKARHFSASSRTE